MKREKDFSDIFDDDFEVTYEDGWEEDQDNYDDDRSRRQDYDRYAEDSRSSRRRSRGGVPLAAPIRKGGRVLSRAASALVRCLTAVLILAAAAYVS